MWYLRDFSLGHRGKATWESSIRYYGSQNQASSYSQWRQGRSNDLALAQLQSCPIPPRVKFVDDL